MTLAVLAKRPGGGDVAMEVPVSVDFRTVLGPLQEPYEQIFADALAGDPTHFARMDNPEEAWRIVRPALDMGTKPLPYAVGTRGPPGTDAMPGGRGWQSVPDPPDHGPTTNANPT
jgi:glucose-6-phosphate 1-dehydrogenase